MRYIPLFFTSCLFLCSCGSSTNLLVSSVNYQAIRTDFAQPTAIPEDAKIIVEYFFNETGNIQPVVYNRTSGIITLDQTKSFIIKPDGTSVSYYDPTVRTQTDGSFGSVTTGSTFNLGGISNALGIGGAFGSLMNATNVSSSQTSGVIRQNSVTITDQPRVNIGPNGCIAMSKAFQVVGIGKTNKDFTNYVDIPMKQSPMQFSICVTYSTDEGETYQKLITHFYVSSQICERIDKGKVSEGFYKIYAQKADALAENMFMFILPNNVTRTNNENVYMRGSLIDFQ